MLNSFQLLRLISIDNQLRQTTQKTKAAHGHIPSLIHIKATYLITYYCNLNLGGKTDLPELRYCNTGCYLPKMCIWFLLHISESVVPPSSSPGTRAPDSSTVVVVVVVSIAVLLIIIPGAIYFRNRTSTSWFGYAGYLLCKHNVGLMTNLTNPSL